MVAARTDGEKLTQLARFTRSTHTPGEADFSAGCAGPLVPTQWRAGRQCILCGRPEQPHVAVVVVDFTRGRRR